MQVIDAYWEERNLGVSCFEIKIGFRDSLEEIKRQYEELKERQYMVVKVLSSRPDILPFFQQKGFSFCETAITLEHNLRSIEVPKRLRKIFGKCSWVQMVEEDIHFLHDQVHKNVFKTDRVYMDPAFTEEQAARRYDCWIKDLIRDGNIPYKVLFQGETVGFFLNKEVKAGVYDGLLAATYSDFEGSGMGYCIQYAGLKYAVECGASKYFGHVSANNPTVLKMLLSMGFSVKEMEYVFIKHI